MASIVPDLDFTPISNLGKIYDQSRSRSLVSELGQRLADGSIDYKQAAGMAAQANQPEMSLSLLKMAYDRAQLEDYNKKYGATFGAPSGSRLHRAFGVIRKRKTPACMSQRGSLVRRPGQ
jgi:hypothetical protein